MRLVTSITKHALGVRDRIHLRKTLRLGSVFFVAAPAEVGYVRQLGHIGNGVVSVFSQGAMAGLATNLRVLSPAMRLGFGIVAEDALASASIGNGERADHVDCTCPIVSKFPKVLGHHGGAENQKNTHSRQQDQPRANQVSRIPEKATQCHPPIQIRYFCLYLRRAEGLPQAWLSLLVQD